MALSASERFSKGERNGERDESVAAIVSAGSVTLCSKIVSLLPKIMTLLQVLVPRII